MRWKIIGHPRTQNINFSCSTRYTIVQKLSNKQNAKAICKFDRLRTSHSKRQKNIEKLTPAYAFNYIVLRFNHGLTSCKDLATALLVINKTKALKTSLSSGFVSNACVFSYSIHLYRSTKKSTIEAYHEKKTMLNFYSA